VPLHHNVV